MSSIANGFDRGMKGSEMISSYIFGGGFVLGNSNAVSWETPKENDDAFLNAWKNSRAKYF